MWDSGLRGTLSVLPSAAPPTVEVGPSSYLMHFSYAGWTSRRLQPFNMNFSIGRIFSKIYNSYVEKLSMASLETLRKLKGQRACYLAAAACLSTLHDGVSWRRRREKRGLHA